MMQFIVRAYDGTDDQASERRLAVREAHVRLAKEMFENGKWRYAAGILNDDGNHVGSMIVCDFASKADFEEQWLRNEPYVTGKVWERIEVKRAQEAPFCAKERT